MTIFAYKTIGSVRGDDSRKTTTRGVGPTDATDLLEQCQWVGLHQQKLTSTASEAKITEAVDKTEVYWRRVLDLT